VSADGLRDALEGLDLRSPEAYARDRSPFAVVPAVAVAAREATDVATVVRAAGEHGVPVTPRAGGSSVAGQCLGEGVVLDVSGLRGVEADGEDVWCGVGESLDGVNRVLAPSGRAVGPDVTASDLARVGGLVGTNACGSRSLRYGRVGEAVRAVEGTWADGEPLALGAGEMPERLADELAAVRDGLESDLDDAWPGRSGVSPAQPRGFGGYRLDAFARAGDALSLVPGSEGTLCVLTRVRLATVAAPRRRALLEVPCPSLRAALDRAPACAAAGASAVEVLDHRLLDACGLSSGRGGALLLVEFLDDEGGPDRLRAALPGDDAALLAEPHAARMWALRRSALARLAARGAAPVAVFEDPAVAPERAGVFAEDLLALLARRGFGEVVVYGHAGAGCLHVRPLCDPADAAAGARLLDALAEVAELVSAHGGALTGEHGWGLARSHLAPAALGRALYARCEQVKRAWDPHGLLSPGRIVGGRDPRAVWALTPA
jgi:FAD/FMN-containing dehydrogenase